MSEEKVQISESKTENPIIEKAQNLVFIPAFQILTWEQVSDAFAADTAGHFDVWRLAWEEVMVDQR